MMASVDCRALPSVNRTQIGQSYLITQCDYSKLHMTRKIKQNKYILLSQFHSRGAYWLLLSTMKNANALLSILFQCFLSIVVFAVNEKSISSCASFFTTQENKRLSGHVVKRVNSGSLLSCGHQCVRNSWCTSANFKMPSKENGQGTCELNKHNISVIDGENAQFRGQQGVIFLMFLKVNFIWYRWFSCICKIRPL